jgi:tetratricopeptide (TPR) repeat protein
MSRLTPKAASRRMILIRNIGLTLLALLVPLVFAQNTNNMSAAELIANGEYYLTNGNFQLAQVAFQTALRAEPDNIDAMIGKGRALVRQGALEMGIDEYSRVLDRNPNHVMARVYVALARVEQYLRDSDPTRLADARDHLARAESADPNNAQVHNTKGLVLYYQGDYANAQGAFEQAINLAARNSSLSQAAIARMHVNLGNSYRELGELERARTAFRRAVQLDPTNAGAHHRLGDIHFKLNDCESAQYELSQAVSLDPTRIDASATLAIATFECGDAIGAIPQLQHAIELGGGLQAPPLYTYLARAYLEQGRTREAVLEAQKGALLPPVTAEAFYWLGQAYQTRGDAGDTESARSAYERALELNPEFTAAQEALSTLP